MTKPDPEGFFVLCSGRVRTEPYTIRERPADPPPQDPRVPGSIPMPRGYQATEPIGGWKTPLPRPTPTSVPGSGRRPPPAPPLTIRDREPGSLFVRVTLTVAWIAGLALLGIGLWRHP